MKFRSDFVTNSSSNSYIVNLAVKPLEGDTIKLDLYPDKLDTDNTEFNLRSEACNIACRVRKCKTVGELTTVLVEESSEGEIKSIIEGINDDYIYYYDEEDDEEECVDLKTEVQGKIQRFKDEMAKFSSLDELDSVIISEIFSGWGECAYDTMDYFLDRIVPEGIPEEWTSEAVWALLSGKFNDEDIKEIDKFVHGGCGSPYGIVNTVITIADGSTHEEYSITV